MKLKFWACLFVVFLCTAGFCEDNFYPARVEDISNKKYFPVLYNALKNSKESVYVVMYLVSFDPAQTESPVYKLLDEVVSAHKRGLKVKVILDYHRETIREKGGVNYPAFKFLRDAGVDVCFDDVNVYTHNKTVVIDRKYVFIGSSNWSVAALCESNETNTLIVSPGLAVELISDMRNIKTAGRLIEESEGINIAYGFVNNKEILGRMSATCDERAFDMYLVLFRESGGSYEEKIDIRYTDLAKELGIFEKMDRTGWRRQINKTLRKLACRYGLIDLETPFSIKLKKLGEESFKLPREFWMWKWNKILLMREKVCLLINFAELGREKGLSKWCMSGEDISQKYGVSLWIVQQGMKGLNRLNLIEIEHSVIKGSDYGLRNPNVYKFNGFYDMNEFQAGLILLEKIYGAGNVTQARRYAAVVRRQYDKDSIADIIRFFDVYGKDAVSRAFAETARKRPDNPQRTFKYTIGIMKKLGLKNPEVCNLY